MKSRLVIHHSNSSFPVKGEASNVKRTSVLLSTMTATDKLKNVSNFSCSITYWKVWHWNMEKLCTWKYINSEYKYIDQVLMCEVNCEVDNYNLTGQLTSQNIWVFPSAVSLEDIIMLCFGIKLQIALSYYLMINYRDYLTLYFDFKARLML